MTGNLGPGGTASKGTAALDRRKCAGLRMCLGDLMTSVARGRGTSKDKANVKGRSRSAVAMCTSNGAMVIGKLSKGDDVRICACGNMGVHRVTMGATSASFDLPSKGCVIQMTATRAADMGGVLAS